MARGWQLLGASRAWGGPCSLRSPPRMGAVGVVKNVAKHKCLALDVDRVHSLTETSFRFQGAGLHLTVSQPPRIVVSVSR